MLIASRNCALADGIEEAAWWSTPGTPGEQRTYSASSQTHVFSSSRFLSSKSGNAGHRTRSWGRTFLHCTFWRQLCWQGQCYSPTIVFVFAEDIFLSTRPHSSVRSFHPKSTTCCTLICESQVLRTIRVCTSVWANKWSSTLRKSRVKWKGTVNSNEKPGASRFVSNIYLLVAWRDHFTSTARPPQCWTSGVGIHCWFEAANCKDKWCCEVDGAFPEFSTEVLAIRTRFGRFQPFVGIHQDSVDVA